MFELRGVAAFSITERRVGLNKSLVAQILKSEQILGLPYPVDPAAAERQRAEVLVNHRQKLFGFGQPVTSQALN